jgi:hypothetical protein
MIVLFEEPETWSLMMLVSSVAIDNAEISEEGKEAIRKWRNERRETSPEVEALTIDLNKALNAYLDAKFMRRVKNRGWYETVRK